MLRASALELSSLQNLGKSLLFYILLIPKNKRNDGWLHRACAEQEFELKGQQCFLVSDTTQTYYEQCSLGKQIQVTFS